MVLNDSGQQVYALRDRQSKEIKESEREKRERERERERERRGGGVVLC